VRPEYRQARQSRLGLYQLAAAGHQHCCTSGSNIQNLNLPIGPDGVVYNSMTRAPIAGATLKMLRGSTPLPATCFDDPAQQGQITRQAATTASTSTSRILAVPVVAATSLW